MAELFHSTPGHRHQLDRLDLRQSRVRPAARISKCPVAPSLHHRQPRQRLDLPRRFFLPAPARRELHQLERLAPLRQCPIGFPNVQLRHRYTIASPGSGSIYLDDFFFRPLPDANSTNWNVWLPFGSVRSDFQMSSCAIVTPSPAPAAARFTSTIFSSGPCPTRTPPTGTSGSPSAVSGVMRRTLRRAPGLPPTSMIPLGC